MLRVSLIAAAFLAVTIALVLMQPGKPRRMAAPEIPLVGDVTRSGPDLAEVGAAVDKPADPLLPSVQAALDPGASAQSPSPEQVAPRSASGLEGMVIEALGQGQSESYIDALVNDAAQKGRVEVPSALVTPEGRVDTAVLLSALSQPARPRVPPSYTVATGDSLAAIAYRFYGNLNRQADIVAVNPDTLGAGARLTVGQVINLPAD
ncbi:MAG: LysM domain-containing protein [Roseovarius sp.]|jgi:nucleoid-associated protein YgaU|uniref:LysM peptidoglycan-binding domain-containing protein n=1 Tax=Roseovarius sp. TaxID=1486281 RepID=UPI0032EF4BF3